MKNITALAQFNPCQGALAYVKKFDSYRDAWDACERGDWMIWVTERLEVDTKLLIKTAALCVLKIRHLMTDERSIEACEVALRFSEGKATKEELRKAKAAAAAHYAAEEAIATAAAEAEEAIAAAAYYVVKAAEAEEEVALVALVAHFVVKAAEAEAEAEAKASGAEVYYVEVETARNKSKSQMAAICQQVLTEAVFEKVEKLT